MTAKEQAREWSTCEASVIYFLFHYGFIYDATEKTWIKFGLWKAQGETLRVIVNNRLVVILKARQLGLTWLCLGYALWLMLFHPAATVLLFSRRDEEAVSLLERLRGMYARLPVWMQAKEIVTSNSHRLVLSNGSEARAFPTTAGDSYTATLAIVDEADLVPDLDRLMASVKPTIDGGGSMILLSRVDKSAPESAFKKIYRAAKAARNGGPKSPWVDVFLPWYVRPARSQDWYETAKADVLGRTGSLDELHEQYPATDTEALAPRSLDKRIPGIWLEGCYEEREGLVEPPDGFPAWPALPGLTIYAAPKFGSKYVIGADPAEGNPTSDASAATVMDRITGEEVARISGRFEPSTFAGYLSQLATYYNKAGVLVERNNHGHAVLLWLRDNSKAARLTGHDGREGWLTNSLGKSLMYDTAADSFRDKQVTLHSFTTYLQLASIEGASLSAPDGEHDDEATGFALANAARTMKVGNNGGFVW